MASFAGDSLVLFDGALPDLRGGAGPLLNDLGAPASRLDWFYGTLAIKAGEWVFPARGLTLFLNTTFDKALHIALYHTTTLEAYQQELRSHLRKTLSPTGTRV